VRHGDTAVSVELDEVAIRESIADVPAHAHFDDLGVRSRASDRSVTRDWLGHRGLRSKDGTILSEARTPPERQASHIYSEGEIVDLLAPVRCLCPKPRATVFETLFGLIASIGGESPRPCRYV
jgi:hypothetical protein